MTIETRQAKLKADIRGGSLAAQVERSRIERVSPPRLTSRKQVAKIRRAVGELSEAEREELRKALGNA